MNINITQQDINPRVKQNVLTVSVFAEILIGNWVLVPWALPSISVYNKALDYI